MEIILPYTQADLTRVGSAAMVKALCLAGKRFPTPQWHSGRDYSFLIMILGNPE